MPYFSFHKEWGLMKSISRLKIKYTVPVVVLCVSSRAGHQFFISYGSFCIASATSF